MNRFCVIGPTCGRLASDIGRKFFETEKEAIAHAASLLSNRQPGSQPCYVVEVKQVVEIAGLPITVRKPDASEGYVLITI